MSAGVGNQIPFLLGHPLRATRHSRSGERWPDLRLGEYGSIVSHNTESCTGLQQLLPCPWNEGRDDSLFLSQRCYGDGWGNVCKASTWARRKGLFQILSVMVTGLSSVLPIGLSSSEKDGQVQSCRRSWTWVQSPRLITNPGCSSAPISSLHKRVLEHSTSPQSIGCMENEWILFAEGDGSWDKKLCQATGYYSNSKFLFLFHSFERISPEVIIFSEFFFFFLITLT